MYLQAKQNYSNLKAFDLAILLVSTIVSGALYFYSTGFNELWYLLWFAPIPIIICAFIYNKSISFIIAFVAYFLGKLSLLNYIGTGMPILVLILSLTFDPFIFAILVLFNRYIVHKINNWVAIFFFPLIWVVYEFSLSLFSPAGSLSSIAYTQIKFLPLIQIASYTGIWGITFLILFFSSGASCAVYFRKRPLQSLLSIVLPIVIIAVVLACGFMRVSSAKSAPNISVGLAAIKTPIRISGQEAIKLSKQYILLTDNIAKSKSKFVVLPEKFVRLKPQAYSKIISLFKKAAKRNRIYIVAGIARFGTKNYNSAVIFNPKGSVSKVLFHIFCPKKVLLINKPMTVS